MDKTGKINVFGTLYIIHGQKGKNYVFGTRFSECGKNHYKLEDCSLQTAYDISIMGFAIKSKMFRHCIERSGVRSI